MNPIRPGAVVFDVGNVLYDWDLRCLYAEHFDEPDALDEFLTRVVTPEWHLQHDLGRPFAETSAELAALYPHHRELIAMHGPRFADSIPGPLPGMAELVAELHAAGVPLFAITNFSGEFWPPFRAREAALFDRFRDIIVSGDERLAKPDPAIFELATARFGIGPGAALFVDDRAENVAASEAAGFIGHEFHDAGTLRQVLVEIGLLLAPA